MAKYRSNVPEEERARLLLWCARHCCFCGRQCTTNIEIHHIDCNSSNNDLDNLIPLCFDCHGELERYNPKHPRGTKYRYLEIKKRRDQIYERHTRQYLRKVSIHVSKYIFGSDEEKERAFGDISCTVSSLSEDIPVRLRLRIEAYSNSNKLNNIDWDTLYSGKDLWNLNPAHIVLGHFVLPMSNEQDTFPYRVEIFWSIVDIFDREHEMLPFSYVLRNRKQDWWFDPTVRYSNKIGTAHQIDKENESELCKEPPSIITDQQPKKGE